jgi:hemoglobin-like flavoprotein
MDRCDLITASLETLHGRESALLERFYELFFSSHPEVCELFGEHGINEREEMLRETLSSVVAAMQEEPWLDENLAAMGRSHAEYGVEGPMYDWYVDTMLEALEEVSGPDWNPECRGPRRAALERLTRSMRHAGETAP